jgi:hypothetical protein
MYFGKIVYRGKSLSIPSIHLNVKRIFLAYLISKVCMKERFISAQVVVPTGRH